MKNKKVLALILAIAMAGAVGTPALKAEAAGLSQAADPNAVVYGKLSKSEIAVLKGLFDYDYYKSENPEVVARIGDSYDKLFEHFYKCGIFEGRTCNANFDPAAYASAYPDLKEKFQKNIIDYYVHYAAFADTGERPLTTIAACAKAGITVETLAGETVKISPQVYKLATAMRTNDYIVVAKAANSVSGGSSSSDSSSSSSSDSSSSAVVKTDGVTFLLVAGDASAYADAKGLTPIRSEIYGHSELTLFIIEGDQGYAAYDNKDWTGHDFFNGKTPVYETSDYIAKANMSTADIVAVYENKSYQGDSEISTGSTNISGLTNAPAYSFTGEFQYTAEKECGTCFDVNWSGVKGSVSDSEEEATDFNLYNGAYELTGYYTNDNGSQSHTFASDEERDAWIASNYAPDVRPDVSMNADYITGIDVDGAEATKYNVGMDIKENNDGTIDVTVGVYNDENKFGSVSTVTVDPDDSEGQQ
ncbi:hypothetical protein [Pseudobutyrivibrio sp. MD2005]|uniref:hypothetical protein n=1 Tax=Pseudobutyrivibrio sp. MD2005 TaxID=1410616 RepID=UPI000489AC6C|nr:hypothetical protein [Pseudobutyrivibrio sp. MD2005]